MKWIMQAYISIVNDSAEEKYSVLHYMMLMLNMSDSCWGDGPAIAFFLTYWMQQSATEEAA